MNDKWRRGAAAGLFATAAMSGVMALGKVLGLLGEPPPHKIVRKLVPSPRAVSVPLAWAAHFGFGAALGGLHSALPNRRSIALACLYGAAVWTVSYSGVIPRLALMPPPRDDHIGRPATMLAAHLVFGATLAFAQRLLDRAPAPQPRTTRSLGLQLAMRRRRYPSASF